MKLPHVRYGVIKLSIAFCRSLYKPLVNEVEIQNYTLCVVSLGALAQPL